AASSLALLADRPAGATAGVLLGRPLALGAAGAGSDSPGSLNDSQDTPRALASRCTVSQVGSRPPASSLLMACFDRPVALATAYWDIPTASRSPFTVAANQSERFTVMTPPRERSRASRSPPV